MMLEEANKTIKWFGPVTVLDYIGLDLQLGPARLIWIVGLRLINKTEISSTRRAKSGTNYQSWERSEHEVRFGSDLKLVNVPYTSFDSSFLFLRSHRIRKKKEKGEKNEEMASWADGSIYWLIIDEEEVVSFFSS